MRVIRTPTIVVFAAAVVLALLYGMARHNFHSLCPKMKEIPAFSLPAGSDDLDDGLTYEMCTDEDPNYLEMQKYEFGAEGCGVLIVVLLAVDWAAFAMAQNRGLSNARSRVNHRSRKFLTRVSRFLGGL